MLCIKGDEQVAQSLVSLLRDKTESSMAVRDEVVRVLSIISHRGCEIALEGFKLAFKDRYLRVRQTALKRVFMISHPQDKRFVVAVCSLLKDTKQSIRWHGMKALRRIAHKGDPVAIDGVLLGLKDSSFAVRYAALEAMKEIMPQEEISAISTKRGLIEQINRDRVQDMTRQALLRWREDSMLKFFRLWHNRTSLSRLANAKPTIVSYPRHRRCRTLRLCFSQSQCIGGTRAKLTVLVAGG